MKRYYCISYSAINDKNSVVNGTCNLVCENTGINQKMSLLQIIEMSKKDGWIINQVIVNNFIEMSENDYLDWIR